MSIRACFAAIAVFLAGCATTAPPAPPSAQPGGDTGRIVLRPFYVPQGTGNNFITALMGGGASPIHIPLYDVTDEPRFLGVLKSRGATAAGLQSAYEHDVPAGNRILMLYMRKFGGGDFVDFVEISVTPGQVEHVALSQYGMNERPFFARVPMPPEASRFCLENAKGLPYADVSAALKSRGVEGGNYRQHYCQALERSDYRRTPVAQDGPDPLKPDHVAKLKALYLDKWRRLADRLPPYDLSQ